VSVRLILVWFESGSFSSKNKSRNSKESGRPEPFDTGLCQLKFSKKICFADSLKLDEFPLLGQDIFGVF
jgi:hypothetical protein